MTMTTGIPMIHEAAISLLSLMKREHRQNNRKPSLPEGFDVQDDLPPDDPEEILRDSQDQGIFVVSDLAGLLGLTQNHIQDGLLTEEVIQQYLAEQDTLGSFLSSPVNHARVLIFTAPDGRAEEISRFRTSLLNEMTSVLKVNTALDGEDLFPNLTDVIWDPAVLKPASEELIALSTAYNSTIDIGDRNKNLADLQAITDLLSLVPSSRAPRIHTRFAHWERPTSHPTASQLVYPKMSYYGTIIRPPSVSFGADMASAAIPQLSQEDQALYHTFSLSLAGYLQKETAISQIRRAVSQIAQRQARIMGLAKAQSKTRISLNIPSGLSSRCQEVLRLMSHEVQGYAKEGDEIILKCTDMDEATGVEGWYAGL